MDANLGLLGFLRIALSGLAVAHAIAQIVAAEVTWSSEDSDATGYFCNHDSLAVNACELTKILEVEMALFID